MMQSCPCMTSSPTVHVWGRFTNPIPFPYRRWWDGHGCLPSLWWCVLADGGLPQTDMYHLPLSTSVLDQSELFSKTSCVCVHMYLCTDVCSTMSSCSHMFSHHGRVHGTCYSWSVLVSEVYLVSELKLLPVLQVGTPLPQLQTHTGAVCHQGCFSYSSNELAVPRVQLEHSGFYVCLAMKNGATYSKTCKVTVGGEEAETAWIDVAYILVLIVPW